MRRLAPLAFVLALTACNFGGGQSTSTSSSSAPQVSSAPAMEFVGEGMVQRMSVGTYQQGTHLLVRDNGAVTALLQSATIRLDDHLDQRVIVTGVQEPEGDSGVVLVAVTDVQVLPELSSSESSASSATSSESSVALSSSSSVASSAAVSSSAVSVAKSSSSLSSKSSVAAVVSSAPVSSSVMATSTSSADPKLTSMQKNSVGADLFKSQYCTVNGGFCLPIHKNWFFTSFQRQAGTLWHVEIGPQEIAAMGEGLIIIDLVKGPLPADQLDQTAVVSGEYVTAYRAWKDNHLVVKAPASLQASAEYIVKSVTEPPAASSAASAAQSSASSSL